MSLASILTKMNEVKPLTMENTDEGPIETLQARRGRKRRAQETLSELKTEYTKEVLRSAVFIMVSGTESSQFIKSVTESSGFFTANPNDFYADLANSVHPTLYMNKPSSSALFDVVGRYLEDKAREAGIIGYPQLTFTQKYLRNLGSKDELQALLTEAINDKVGGEFAVIDSTNRIVDKIIESGHSALTTPIVLDTNNDQLIVDLLTATKRLTPNVFLVTAGKAPKYVKSIPGCVSVKDASEQNIKEALTAIKNRVTKNK